MCCDLLSPFHSIVFLVVIWFFQKLNYFCHEANHNKDYSVVKTFKAGQLAFFHA